MALSPATGKALLRDTDVDAFGRDGYTVVDRPIFSDVELSYVHGLYDSAAAVDRQRHIHNLGTDDAHCIDETVWATRLVPALKRSAVFLRSRQLASELLAGDVSFHFDHVIDKPAGSLGVTYWHQDQAFEPDGGEKVTIWVPFVSVDQRNGCMWFVPGSHRLPLLRHYAVGEGLRTDEFDESHAVPAPVRRGGFTAHRELTLHSTGANDTLVSRPAWVLRFSRYTGKRGSRVLSEVMRGRSSAPGLAHVKGRKPKRLRPEL